MNKCTSLVAIVVVLASSNLAACSSSSDTTVQPAAGSGGQDASNDVSSGGTGATAGTGGSAGGAGRAGCGLSGEACTGPADCCSASCNESRVCADDVFAGPIYETHPYYYDGTYRGLTAQIPSIADLGVRILYILPIWPHKGVASGIYLINDYGAPDPTYGTDDELRELVATAHRYGMRVLFDLVTCCAPGPDSVPWKNGWILQISMSDLQAKAAAKTPPWNLTNDTRNGVPVVYHDCVFPDSGVATCDFFGVVSGSQVYVYTTPLVFGPAIDRTNPDVIAYFRDVAQRHIRDFDIDGWRIDAPGNKWNPEIFDGDHSDLPLLQAAKAAVTASKPGAIFYSEQPGLTRADAGTVPTDNAFDDVAEISYAYWFRDYLAKSMSNGGINSDDFVRQLTSEQTLIQQGRARSRFCETHDESRVASTPWGKPCVVLQSTVPGVPMIQAGQEIGAKNAWFAGDVALPTVDWTNSPDKDLVRTFYKKVFQIRRSSAALKHGSISDVWIAGDGVYAFLRSTDTESAVVAVNLSAQPVSAVLKLPPNIGATLRDQLSGETFNVGDPLSFQLPMVASGTRILLPE
jgi:glycosidase